VAALARRPGDATRALRALRFAAKDQLRDTHRDLTRATPFDFTALDDPHAESGELASTVRRTLAAHAATADEDAEEPGLYEAARAALRDAEAALTRQERRVLRLANRGLNLRQIADRIGISHQRARVVHMNARALVEQLAAHALGRGPTPEELARLTALHERRLTGRTRRQVRRHLDACPTCQRIVTTNGHLRHIDPDLNPLEDLAS